MAFYGKSLQDYIRIPILLKNLTSISQQSLNKLNSLLYYKYYPLVIDERYIIQASSPNAEILRQRHGMTQKLYFICEDFNTEWPEFQVNYKAKFAMGIVDESSDQKQIQEALQKVKNENGIKLIGVINMGASTLEHLYKKENIIKVPDLNQQEFLHFIQPWLYNCLSLIQSEICNIISQLKKDDESNRTIVFNRLQEKFDQKIMKKKKKYRCFKLCGDYHLMLHLYQQAFTYFNQAEQLLKKIDDYLWILGCLQGKLACVIISPEINLSNRQEYIQQLINETYSISKKTKNWNFQCQNYFKIAKLHVDEPQKIDELMRNFLINYAKNIADEQKFLLYTTMGNLYEKSGFLRKRNYFYFLAACIHLNKKSEVSSLLLIEIQKGKSLKQWPYLYKKILQLIIQQQDIVNSNQYYLELLSKCTQDLSTKEITNILSQLNFNNNEVVRLESMEFLQLKQFYAIESSIKPKQNRIGNRESPRKVGGGFFMSWKRQENLLFEENEDITLKGSIVNKIAFPIRVKISFNIHSFSDRPTVCSHQEVCLYLQPSTIHKFETNIKAKGVTEELWVIDQLKISMWNFESQVKLITPIKYEIYEKQPQIQLDLQKQLLFEESCNLFLESQLQIKNLSIPFSLVKLNVSVYYSIDVGFQQNEVILRNSQNFLDIDFNNRKNLRIHESKGNESVEYKTQDGVLIIRLKKLKAHRQYISRMQFTLEHIRSLNTKFQISKQYVRKCNFYSKFLYKIERISTPLIDSAYKSSIKNEKIIEDQYKLCLKISKNNINNLKSYMLTYNNVSYRLANANQLLIQQISQKLDPKSQRTQLKETLYWQCESTKIKGEIQITIPVQQLMKKCNKNVNITIQESKLDNHKRLKVNYSITSAEQTCLSHHIILNPIDIQIDRMYTLRGKTKFQLFGKAVSNKFECLFGSKAKNCYQLGFIFTDGWIYWHKDLITVNKA